MAFFVSFKETRGENNKHIQGEASSDLVLLPQRGCPPFLAIHLSGGCLRKGARWGDPPKGKITCSSGQVEKARLYMMLSLYWGSCQGERQTCFGDLPWILSCGSSTSGQVLLLLYAPFCSHSTLRHVRRAVEIVGNIDLGFSNQWDDLGGRGGYGEMTWYIPPILVFSPLLAHRA